MPLPVTLFACPLLTFLQMNKVFLAPLDSGEQKTLLELIWRVVTAADGLKA
jgi:hypothetical protein